ncbi:hypothetical protein HYPSUDRAFT_37298 [Hypholoma sublateritium FD-334 SS-4]|uniref:Membrane-associated proteins in eicosanoid and glutathione metabolism n=1 Tax=Hypholoma sublateritium (strain FD-334 SS-4) TaxID=945553 RepID=A0A0D2MPG4_HYPSF|nr:hypothetical protein HYPSUDRAFT_37298 [Hypholoma sublateritium FD-334 SS-4]
MSTTITVPAGFAYLAPAFASTVLLLLGQTINVSRHRKLANIPYPQVYAENKEAEASKAAYIFNCAQRAHQNTLEQLPVLYVTTILTALKYPVVASSALGFWALTRVSYTRGYSTGEPKKRGSFLFKLGSLISVGLIFSSVYVSGAVANFY